MSNEHDDKADYASYCGDDDAPEINFYSSVEQGIEANKGKDSDDAVNDKHNHLFENPE